MAKINHHYSQSRTSSLDDAWDKHGVYVRELTARFEIWPMIEHWAHECGYRLVDLRSGKRTYRFRSHLSWFSEVVEITERDKKVTIRAWHERGPLAKLFTRSFKQSFLSIDNDFLFCCRTKRHFTKCLDTLLKRFHVKGFKPLATFSLWDLKISTLTLLFVSALSIAASSALALSQNLWIQKTWWYDLSQIMKFSGFAIIAQLGLTGIFFLLRKHLKKLTANTWVMPVFFSMLCIVTSFVAQSFSKDLLREIHIAQMCVLEQNLGRCNELIDTLDTDARNTIALKLKSTSKIMIP